MKGELQPQSYSYTSSSGVEREISVPVKDEPQAPSFSYIDSSGIEDKVSDPKSTEVPFSETTQNASDIEVHKVEPIQEPLPFVSAPPKAPVFVAPFTAWDPSRQVQHVRKILHVANYVGLRHLPTQSQRL